MNNRKRLYLLTIIIVLSIVGIFFLENDTISVTREKRGNTNYLIGASDNVPEEYKDKNNILYKNDLSIEVVSWEMIEDEDIENQNKYKSEWFYSGDIPDGGYMEEYIDREAVMKESPELRILWNENNKYSIEEIQEIYNRNLYVIEKYTLMHHPKTRYLFAKCRITNLKNGANDTNISLDIFISHNSSEYLEWQECDVYFDKAVYINGDEREHKFFWYPFEKGETIECVLGYEIKEHWDENEKYYLGVQSAGVDFFTFENTQLVDLDGLNSDDE